MTFGQRLKYFRKKVRKSQKKIEGETGIPQTTLSGWENDISEPTVSDIVKLATAFDIQPSDLLDGPVPQDETCCTSESKLAG